MNVKVWELILIVMVALGLGFRQLYDINRELRKDREKQANANAGKSKDDDEHGGKTQTDDASS